MSGLTYRVDLSAPLAERVQEVRVGGTPLEVEKLYTIAVPDYLIEGGDGYTMLGDQPVLVAPDEAHRISEALERYIVSRGAVAPVVDGRITRTR